MDLVRQHLPARGHVLRIGALHRLNRRAQVPELVVDQCRCRLEGRRIAPHFGRVLQFVERWSIEAELDQTLDTLDVWRWWRRRYDGTTHAWRNRGFIAFLQLIPRQ